MKQEQNQTPIQPVSILHSDPEYDKVRKHLLEMCDCEQSDLQIVEGAMAPPKGTVISVDVNTVRPYLINGKHLITFLAGCYLIGALKDYGENDPYIWLDITFLDTAQECGISIAHKKNLMLDWRGCSLLDDEGVLEKMREVELAETAG